MPVDQTYSNFRPANAESTAREEPRKKRNRSQSRERGRGVPVDSLLLYSVTPEPKKLKMEENSFKVELIEMLGFCEIENTLYRTIQPNENVVANIQIRNGKELWIRIIFKRYREIVYIEDTSFGVYSYEKQIRRLENLLKNLGRLQDRKEELFAKFQNWEKFMKSGTVDSSKSTNTTDSTQSQSKSDDDGSHHENGPACKSSEDIENGARMNHVESSPNPPVPMLQMDLVPPGYPNLSADISNKIREWMNADPSESISTKLGRIIYGRDIRVLQKDAQQVRRKNALLKQYIDLIVDRCNQKREESWCAMGTEFFESLLDDSCGTKKYLVGDIKFDYSDFFIPIHHNNHYALIVIDSGRKEIVHYDSLNQTGEFLLAKLKDYIKTDCEQRSLEFDFSQWKMYSATDVPQQTDGNDTDVFVCAIAESLARNQRNLVFTQEHLPYFRNKITYEIGTSQLLN